MQRQGNLPDLHTVFMYLACGLDSEPLVLFTYRVRSIE